MDASVRRRFYYLFKTLVEFLDVLPGPTITFKRILKKFPSRARELDCVGCAFSVRRGKEAEKGLGLEIVNPQIPAVVLS